MIVRDVVLPRLRPGREPGRHTTVERVDTTRQEEFTATGLELEEDPCASDRGSRSVGVSSDGN
jgi:hypothetical protein